VECLYFRDCIFKFVSFSFITVYKNFRFLAGLWANNNKLAIPTGNTFLKRQQCDVCHVVLVLWLWKYQKSIPKVRVHIYAFICSFNSFYFPVLLFYSVDACPPQRTYVSYLPENGELQRFLQTSSINKLAKMKYIWKECFLFAVLMQSLQCKF
jgi:hypothetical protein